MYPVICRVGPVAIYSYGMMLALAVVVCAVLARQDAKRLGLDGDTIVDTVFWIVAGGIIGGRLFFVFLNFSSFYENPLEIFMLNRGGLAWQGALVAGAFTASVVLKKKSLPIVKTFDIFAPYIALGQSIGRIGCFLNGCCYGKPVPWGIYFPVHQAHLHPTQLYSSFGLLVIFFILKRYQHIARKPGEVFVLYLILASVQRFVVEFFRGDHTTFLWGFSIFQIVSICILIVAIYATTLINSRPRK